MTKTAVRDDDFPEDFPVLPGWAGRMFGGLGWAPPNNSPMDSDYWFRGPIDVGDFYPSRTANPGTTWTTTSYPIPKAKPPVADSLPKDTPEPPVGTVVLTSDGLAFQRFAKEEGSQYWRGTDGTYSAWMYLLRRGLTVLHFS